MQLTKRWSVVLILLFPLFGIAQKQVNIIPKPLSLIVEEGHFTIDKNTGIIFNSKEKDLHHAAIFSIHLLKMFPEFLCLLMSKKINS